MLGKQPQSGQKVGDVAVGLLHALDSKALSKQRIPAPADKEAGHLEVGEAAARLLEGERDAQVLAGQPRGNDPGRHHEEVQTPAGHPPEQQTRQNQQFPQNGLRGTQKRYQSNFFQSQTQKYVSSFAVVINLLLVYQH